ncbi:histone methylation protein DOT1-domain-containing protein [Myxozyma melibiosi]|uniref:Histone-lysine N-methyltransferase, H3 lysine-79 specific n=1 Tax=Myxozyma melibiosi TaxID=54550 RepID=A0ABR1EY47_9ASCO
MSSFFSSLSKQSSVDTASPSSGNSSSTVLKSTPTGAVRQGRSKDVKYKTVIVTRQVVRAPVQQQPSQSSGRGNYQQEILRRLKKRKKDRVTGNTGEKEKEKEREKEERAERKRAAKSEKSKGGEKKGRKSKAESNKKSKEFITSDDELSDLDEDDIVDDEDDEDEDENDLSGSDDEEQARAKKPKLSPSVAEWKADDSRVLLKETIFEAQTESPQIIHSFDVLSHETAGYTSLFADEEDDFIDLKYPGIADFTERFYLGAPSKDDYDPVAEIANIMQATAQFYLPYDEAQKIHTSDLQDCITRRIKRATKRKSLYAFKTAIEEYNSLVEETFHNAANAEKNKQLITKSLGGSRENMTAFAHEILSEIYGRVVSPHVSELRKYEAFSSNVYGELLPKFVTKIFRELEMDSGSVFVDLGSGVGNCVLQAALELGCRAYGCEMMPRASALATRQENELKERLKLWGVEPGETTLLAGDFVTNEEIGGALENATVLLVNNYAFDAELNNSLVNMFLDLKDGTKIVSLKSFVPPGHKITQHNAESPINLLKVEEREFYSGSVSWTDAPGSYYVSTVDRSRMKKFAEGSASA